MKRVYLCGLVLALFLKINAQICADNITDNTSRYFIEKYQMISVLKQGDEISVEHKGPNWSREFTFPQNNQIEFSRSNLYNGEIKYVMTYDTTQKLQLNLFFGFVDAGLKGAYEIYYDDALREKGRSLNFIKNGEVTKYFESGIVAAKYDVNNGNQLGLQKEFNKKGELIREFYQNPYTPLWLKEYYQGKLTYYKKNTPKVRYWKYYNSGEIRHVYAKDSASIGYFKNGQIRNSYTKNAKGIWESKRFYYSGQLSEYQEYKGFDYRETVGAPKCYDENGNSIECEFEDEMEIESSSGLNQFRLSYLRDLAQTPNIKQVYEKDIEGIKNLIISSFSKKEVRKLKHKTLDLKVAYTGFQFNDIKVDVKQEVSAEIQKKLEANLKTLEHSAPRIPMRKKEFEIHIEF